MNLLVCGMSIQIVDFGVGKMVFQPFPKSRLHLHQRITTIHQLKGRLRDGHFEYRFAGRQLMFPPALIGPSTGSLNVHPILLWKQRLGLGNGVGIVRQQSYIVVNVKAVVVIDIQIFRNGMMFAGILVVEDDIAASDVHRHAGRWDRKILDQAMDVPSKPRVRSYQILSFPHQHLRSDLGDFLSGISISISISILLQFFIVFGFGVHPIHGRMPSKTAAPHFNGKLVIVVMVMVVVLIVVVGAVAVKLIVVQAALA
jgi:hypothetical protein